jgi:hypothetical protein
MSKPVVEVQVRAVAALGGGCAVFLGNEDKAFVMFVDQSVGAAITMFMQGTQKERPLTHDLLANVLRALGAKIDRVVVNDLKGWPYETENKARKERVPTTADKAILVPALLHVPGISKNPLREITHSLKGILYKEESRARTKIEAGENSLRIGQTADDYADWKRPFSDQRWQG